MNVGLLRTVWLDLRADRFWQGDGTLSSWNLEGVEGAGKQAVVANDSREISDPLVAKGRVGAAEGVVGDVMGTDQLSHVLDDEGFLLGQIRNRRTPADDVYRLLAHALPARRLDMAAPLQSAVPLPGRGDYRQFAQRSW